MSKCLGSVIVACAMIASLAGCAGDPPPETESRSSAAMTAKTFRGSYQCGPDWWHIQQTIRWGSDSVFDPRLKVGLSDQLAPGDETTTNAIDILCNTPPVLMQWGGVSWYNSATVGDCTMWAHRANHGWSFSAYVRMVPGGLQWYPGTPETWEIEAWNVGGAGTNDGISAACGGHFLTLVQ